MSKPVFKTTGGPRKPEKPTGNFTIEVPRGDYVFKEGDLGTEMYIVQDGRVEILKRVHDHDEDERQVAVLEKGDFFGEMSILEELPRTASARSLIDTKLLQINGSTFDQMLRTNPEIAVRMMRKLSRRLRETDQLLRDAAGNLSGEGAPEMPTPSATAGEGTGPQRLLHTKSGMEFFLANTSETTIGRKDPVTGIHPDIDLTPVDGQRSISRRHAKVYRRGSRFFVAEEIGTMNGTFVNNVRIETGVPVEIKQGDEVRFGVIETTFQLA
ncbi:MAG: cyclic nucleotide-binding domain-containing protein [Acidobacteriota bacterium]